MSFLLFSLNAVRRARAFLKASYIVFAGCLLMLPAAIVSHGVSGGESSVVAAPIMLGLAIVWQIVTVTLNRNRWEAWFLLALYILFLAILAISIASR